MTARFSARIACALALLLVGLASGCLGAAGILSAKSDNSAIDALRHGQDIAVSDNATAVLLAARGRFVIAHGDIATAQILADELAGRGADGVRSGLLTAIGSARMRLAYVQMSKIPFWKVKPIIALAKSGYRLAVTLDPDNWDARYNYAIAASLLRDTEAASPTAGTAMAHQRAVWPDIPGAPNGMP